MKNQLRERLPFLAAAVVVATAGALGLGTAKIELDRSQQLLNDATTQSEQLTTQQDDLLDEIATLEEEASQVENLQDENTRLQEELDAANAEIAELQTEATSQVQQIQSLQEAVDTSNSENLSLSTQLEDATQLGTTGNPYVVDVWTAGFQDEIDLCLGAVDVTARYPTPTIAEHSHCGGDEFPRTEGTVIRVTGANAGLYRMDGLVARLNAYTDRPSDIPLGVADLMYQTCLNGASDMGFFALTRIGD